MSCNSTYRLRYWNSLFIYFTSFTSNELQQHLPLAVLKQSKSLRWGKACLTSCNSTYRLRYWNSIGVIGLVIKPIGVATALTACGIETIKPIGLNTSPRWRCNSTYRLRYWNPSGGPRQGKSLIKLQQHLPLAVLKPLSAPKSKTNTSCCNSTYRLRYWNVVVTIHV